jgi:ppGpp synthetase/RelA/SpoT-type nucleotidyltranferase
MAEDLEQHVLSQYDDRVDLYRELASKVMALLEEMLQEERVRVHSITSRLKERESLRKKID